MSETLPNSRKLPPSSRDIEIYESVHIQNCSTWHIADRHHISQTRVRQIIRRVIEWLSDVLPPQATLAKEQELRLAREIAADRFHHQLEEIVHLWEQSRESKYAGIRIRLTTAQARLGVVGGIAAGLLADASEGIPVPIWEGEAPPEPTQARSASEGTGSEDGFNPDPDPDPPVIYCDPIAWDKLTPEIIAARQAAGRPIHQFLIQYAIDHGVLPQPDATSEREAAPDSNPKSKIQNLKSPASDADSSPPPPGDFSTSNKNSAQREQTVAAQSNQTSDASVTCDDNTADPTPAAQPTTTPSQPLLTTNDSMRPTELKISPDQPGANISTIENQPRPPSAPLPCPPSPAS
jgi:hypothetical protein